VWYDAGILLLASYIMMMHKVTNSTSTDTDVIQPTVIHNL